MTPVSFDLIAVVAIMLLTQIAKNWILPKWGETGLHVFVGILAVAATAIQVAMTTYPGFGHVVLEVGAFLVSAVGMYKVFISKIPGATSGLPPEN